MLLSGCPRVCPADIDFKEPLLLLLRGQGDLLPRESLRSVRFWVINKLS